MESGSGSDNTYVFYNIFHNPAYYIEEGSILNATTEEFFKISFTYILFFVKIPFVCI